MNVNVKSGEALFKNPQIQNKKKIILKSCDTPKYGLITWLVHLGIGIHFHLNNNYNDGKY